MEEPSRKTILLARTFAGFCTVILGSIALPLCIELITKHKQIVDCFIFSFCSKGIGESLTTALATILATFCYAYLCRFPVVLIVIIKLFLRNLVRR